MTDKAYFLIIYTIAVAILTLSLCEEVYCTIHDCKTALHTWVYFMVKFTTITCSVVCTYLMVKLSACLTEKSRPAAEGPARRAERLI